MKKQFSLMLTPSERATLAILAAQEQRSSGALFRVWLAEAARKAGIEVRSGSGENKTTPQRMDGARAL